jgi:chemotaxis methyl-accepting protein methylase
MLEKRIQKRILSTNCGNLSDYYLFIKQNGSELDILIDSFTINVSRFFRNSLSFEFIAEIIIPNLVLRKLKNNENNLRVWSAGCSFGQEAYSMAILFNEFFSKEDYFIDLNIFATDIDEKALIRANEGKYTFESIKDVKFDIFNKYFTQVGNQFVLDSRIKEMVQYSSYDLLHNKSFVPPDSIYGGFDIVLCRNVLIYFDLEYQQKIFSKLYKSLKPNSYLVLGESEVLLEEYRFLFKRENKYCKIYRKL